MYAIICANWSNMVTVTDGTKSSEFDWGEPFPELFATRQLDDELMTILLI